MSGYDTAQVCPNGHMANSSFIDLPEFNKDYCDRCGEKTFTTCRICEKPIQGNHRGTLGFCEEPPSHCKYCGNAFPWTTRKIEAAIELATEDGGLSHEDAERFKESVNDIVRDTPRTQIGASRFQGLLKKVGQQTAQAVRDILVDIVSETAKKSIWPDR